MDDLAQAAKMAVWEATAGVEPPFKSEPLLKAAKKAIQKELNTELYRKPTSETDLFAFAPKKDTDTDDHLDDEARRPTYPPSQSTIYEFRRRLRELLTEDEIEVLERAACWHQAESMYDHRGFADIAEDMGLTVAEVKALLLSAKAKAAEMDSAYVRHLRRSLKTIATKLES